MQDHREVSFPPGRSEYREEFYRVTHADGTITDTAPRRVHEGRGFLDDLNAMAAQRLGSDAVRMVRTVMVVAGDWQADGEAPLSPAGESGARPGYVGFIAGEDIPAGGIGALRPGDVVVRGETATLGGENARYVPEALAAGDLLVASVHPTEPAGSPKLKQWTKR